MIMRGGSRRRRMKGRRREGTRWEGDVICRWTIPDWSGCAGIRKKFRELEWMNSVRLDVPVRIERIKEERAKGDRRREDGFEIRLFPRGAGVKLYARGSVVLRPAAVFSRLPYSCLSLP